jgi:hypothetical protein
VSFPTTGVLDDFNRSDEGPPPSASWTDIDSGLQVISNQCGGASGTNLSYWDVETFGPDCEAYWTIINYSAEQGPLARLQDVGSMGTLDGYCVYVNGLDTIAVVRFDNGVPTQLGADISQTIEAGDKIGVECIGSDIKAWYDDGGAGWGEIGSRSDATYGAVGYIAGYIKDASQRCDDFGGGTVVTEGVVAGRLVNAVPLKSLVHGGLV